MIQFHESDTDAMRLEKLRRLAGEVDRLGRDPPAVVNAPPSFGRVRRIYIDPSSNELVVLTEGGAERRYAAVP